MLNRAPRYNRIFRCLGGACPDTCCRDWEIVLDEGALADYQNAPPELREQLARSLRRGEDGEVCFALREDGLCALLTPEGLCAIQRDWGEEHLCAHCSAYPRFTEEYGCLTETALAVSCPEAARLLLEAETFELEEWDDGGESPPSTGWTESCWRGWRPPGDGPWRCWGTKAFPCGSGWPGCWILPTGARAMWILACTGTWPGGFQTQWKGCRRRTCGRWACGSWRSVPA